MPGPLVYDFGWELHWRLRHPEHRACTRSCKFGFLSIPGRRLWEPTGWQLYVNGQEGLQGRSRSSAMPHFSLLVIGAESLPKKYCRNHRSPHSEGLPLCAIPAAGTGMLRGYRVQRGAAEPRCPGWAGGGTLATRLHRQGRGRSARRQRWGTLIVDAGGLGAGQAQADLGPAPEPLPKQ